MLIDMKRKKMEKPYDHKAQVESDLRALVRQNPLLTDGQLVVLREKLLKCYEYQERKKSYEERIEYTIRKQIQV